ncbi:MAG: hypothetical protein Ct9H300mP1_08940 [Planctomycetaceae bacterium]|nr:MAG: hypothetical protein Ct9H300mP1_08940 [Planctomycetaceae bacterium]
MQLHGDETPGFLAELRAACPGVRLLKAVRVDETGLDELAGYLEMSRAVDAVPDACLVDARVEGKFGGTGQSPPWPLLARDYGRPTGHHCCWPAGWNPEMLAGPSVRCPRPVSTPPVGWKTMRRQGSRGGGAFCPECPRCGH